MAAASTLSLDKMTGLRVEIRRGAAALHELHDDWQRLWLAQPRREVFTSRAWCIAAWQADGESAEVCLVLVRRGATLVGLLPLTTTPARLLSGVNVDYNDMLVCDASPSEVVSAALLAVQASFERCVFDHLPEWSTLCRVFDQLPARLRRCILVEPGQPCPALRLATDRDAVLASMIGKQSLKRHEKKLAKHGTLRLWHVDDRDTVLGLLDDFFAQHVSRRALAGGRSLFLDERSRAFYHRLIEQFDPAIELRFAALEVDGRAVAYHLGFELDGRFTWYKPSFDVDYWDCGVGEVLLKRLLEYVRERQVNEFDFTRGDESFKDRFSNHQGQNVRWTLHSNGIAQTWAAWRSRTRQALKVQPQVLALRRWIAVTAERCRPAPGSRTARHARGGVLGALLGLHRLVLQREEVVLLSIPRETLLAHDEASAACETFAVESSGLRGMAMQSVARDALLDFDDLQRTREELQPTDRIFLAREGGAAAALAWVGTRSRVKPPVPALGAKALELQAPAAVIQFVGSAWPVPDRGRLATMLAAMVRDSVHDTVWLACPAAASSHLDALREVGFGVEARIGGFSIFSGPWHRWCRARS